MELEDSIRQNLSTLWPHLGERERRLVAACHARQIGHGGVSIVSRACGLSRVTITKGMKELDEPPLEEGRIHKPGAGRPNLESKDPKIIEDLRNILEETTRGDPGSFRIWTCKSTRTIASILQSQGHRVGHSKVQHLLHCLGYSLQSNKKIEEGNDHPDRDLQFKYINNLVKYNINLNNPVISVDAKKKELVGNYHNKGRQWLKAKNPKKVQDVSRCKAAFYANSIRLVEATRLDCFAPQQR
jgi:transposase